MEREEQSFWLLTLLVLLVALVGCQPPSPLVGDDPYEPHAEALFAYQIYKVSKNPTPITPTPVKVVVGDECPTCEGSGSVDGDKDGKPDYKCSDCSGDGRVDDGDPILLSGTTDDISIVVPPLTRSEFDAIVQEVKNFGQSFAAWIEEDKQGDARFDSGISELFYRTAKLAQEVAELKTGLDKVRTNVLSSQEKNSQGHWEYRTRTVCRDGRCYEERYRVWVPDNPQTYQPGYPIRPKATWWTQGGRYVSWVHLTQGEHHNQFDYDYLRSLSFEELQSLHSDAHEGKVNWQYARPY